MSHKVLSKNASMLKLGGLMFAVEDGKLLIQAPNERYPFPLNAQQTHALYNLLCDYRLDLIGASLVEQRATERKNKDVYKKPKRKLTDQEAEKIRQQFMNVFYGGGEAISEHEAEQEA